jgi:hypothetical protein
MLVRCSALETGVGAAAREGRRVAELLFDAQKLIDTASRVSVSVPIWFTLTSSEFATPASMPRCRRSGFVTNRSSPTS